MEFLREAKDHFSRPSMVMFRCLLQCLVVLFALPGCGPGYRSWKQLTYEQADAIRKGKSDGFIMPHPGVLDEISADPQLAKKVLEIEFGNDLSSYDSKTLSRFPNLTFVSIYGGNNTDKLVNSLRSCISLKELVIQECDITNDGVYSISGCSGLESIKIETEITKLSEEAVMSLRGLSQLRGLRIYNMGRSYTIQDVNGRTRP